MPGGYKNIKPEDRTKGFDKHPENINRKGQPRKVSIKKELENILLADGVIKFTGKQIVEVGEENGVQFVKVKLPTQNALAHKMVSIAMGSNKYSNTLRALIQLLEQFDGKPSQQIDARLNGTLTNSLDDKERDEIINEIQNAKD